MRGRPPQISEERLLGAAAEVFLRRGASATTAEIARHAGVSEGLIFYRYATKDDLIAAVIEREFQPAPELVALIGDPGDRPVADVLYDLAAHVLAGARRVFPFIELARSSAGFSRIARALARTGATPERQMELVARYFALEARRERLRAVPARIAARLLVGVALERTISEHGPVKNPGPEDDDAFLRGVVDLLLHGAAPRPPRRRSSR